MGFDPVLRPVMDGTQQQGAFQRPPPPLDLGKFLVRRVPREYVMAQRYALPGYHDPNDDLTTIELPVPVVPELADVILLKRFIPPEAGRCDIVENQVFTGPS